MTMKQFAMTLILTVACGGGSRPAPTTAPATDPATDPVPMPEGPTAPTVEPAELAAPAAPAAPDPAQVKASLLAAETQAFERAKPVFEKWCASCHSKDGKRTSAKKREHFDMTTYPFGGHHAMEISGEIREALGLTGKRPTMPADKKGAVRGAELDAIAAWADAFDASHRGGAHEGHGGHGGGHSH